MRQCIIIYVTYYCYFTEIQKVCGARHAHRKERGKGKRQNVDSILVEKLSGKMDTQRKEKQMGQYYNESLGHQYGEKKRKEKKKKLRINIL